MTEVSKKIIRKFTGLVVKDKMDKTVVVKIDRRVENKKYHKKFLVTKRYKCHDPKNEYKIGDKVEFIGCRPLSKEKRWRVINKV
jgi:small subunit ribosomal protein S17